MTARVKQGLAAGKNLLQNLRQNEELSWNPASALQTQSFSILDGLNAVLSLWTSYVVDAIVAGMGSLRHQAIEHVGFGVAGYGIWLLWAIVFALAASASGHLISPNAEGSGIPQMKSILSGTMMTRYLTVRVLIAKVTGVISALVAGLSVGKEGPFVHVAAIIASKLWQLPGFSSIRNNESLRRQTLAAAVAAGVTAVLGAPVGGVLFSIEVTATYYMVSNLWRAFVCSVCCVFTFEVINALKDDELFHQTQYETGRDVSAEVLSYVVLGVVCGLLGSLFVYFVAKAVLFVRYICTTVRRRYILCMIVAAIVATATYPAAYLRKSDRDVINDLFQSRMHSPDEGPAGISDWDDPSRVFTLLIYAIIKLIITCMSISLPIPCGLFTPLFIVGAAVGRLYGEIVDTLILAIDIETGAYAVVAAAAITAGATQTLSTAVIVFELTGQLDHMLPVLVATLIAYSVSGMFTLSIYDVLLSLKGLPYLPRVHSAQLYALQAKDVMHTEPRYLTLFSTYRDALRLLKLPPHSSTAGHVQPMFEFPVVNSTSGMVLVGSVQRVHLEAEFAKRADLENGLRRAASSRGGGGGFTRSRRQSESAGGIELERLNGAVTDDENHEVGKEPEAGIARSNSSQRQRRQPTELDADQVGLLQDDFDGLVAVHGSEGAVRMFQVSKVVDHNFDDAWLDSYITYVGDIPSEANTHLRVLVSDPRATRHATGASETGSTGGRSRASSVGHAYSGRLQSGISSETTHSLDEDVTHRSGSAQASPRLRPSKGSGQDTHTSVGVILEQDVEQDRLTSTRAAQVASSTPASTTSRGRRGSAPIPYLNLHDPGRGDMRCAVRSSDPDSADGPIGDGMAGGNSVVRLDPAPFQMSQYTALTKLHFMFAICLFAQVFITHEGKYMGVVLKSDMSNPRRLNPSRLTAGASENEALPPQDMV